MLLVIAELLVPFLVAVLATSWVFPKVLKISLSKNIVDNPDARKLQRNPVPVMGGVAVFFGIISGFAAATFLTNVAALLPIFVAISVMLCVGVIDDMSELSTRLRFVIEIAMSLMLVFWSGVSLNDFHGLWGIGAVPLWVSLPAL